MHEREWREASDMRSSLVSIGLVVVSGALLRYWNLRHGAMSTTEMQIVEPVVQLLQTGSYHPQALTQPTLPVYLHAGIAVMHFLWGAIAGAWRSTSAFGAAQLVAWGRGSSALLGTATVFVVCTVRAADRSSQCSYRSATTSSIGARCVSTSRTSVTAEACSNSCARVTWRGSNAYSWRPASLRTSSAS